jgi:hypothetical protein
MLQCGHHDPARAACLRQGLCGHCIAWEDKEVSSHLRPLHWRDKEVSAHLLPLRWRSAVEKHKRSTCRRRRAERRGRRAARRGRRRLARTLVCRRCSRQVAWARDQVRELSFPSFCSLMCRMRRGKKQKRCHQEQPACSKGCAGIALERQRGGPAGAAELHAEAAELHAEAAAGLPAPWLRRWRQVAWARHQVRELWLRSF